MHILCAPDSFKESLGVIEVACAMAAGAIEAGPAIEVVTLPIADGGEGSLDVLAAPMDITMHRTIVTGPIGEPVNARFGISGDGHTAVIELAEASGLALVPAHRRDPTRTTTYGTGQLIARAVDDGCRTILLLIGGSATCDGGAGIAQALGARFHDEAGLISTPMTGGDLGRVRAAYPPPRLPEIRIACDVTNPLTGPTGAAAVYAPQKGATPEQVTQLEDGLASFARVIGGDPDTIGFGAAGGVALALSCLCGAQLQRGVDLVLEAVAFERRCRGASLVLTGEGRLDEQTLHGKACLGVARAAAELGVPTVAIVGSKGPGWERCVGDTLLADVVSLAERFGKERAMTETAARLREVAHKKS